MLHRVRPGAFQAAGAGGSIGSFRILLRQC